MSTESQSSKPTTLQEFEDQTLMALKKKQKESKAKAEPKAKAKAKAKARAKAKATAKPKATGKLKDTFKATAKTQATGKAKPVPKAQSEQGVPPHKRKAPIYGCPKCRGNPTGCGQCLDANYTGMRLPGRETYRAHMARRAMGH